jgi:hypothetical protein
MQNIDGSTSRVLIQQTPRGGWEDNIYVKSRMKTDIEYFITSNTRRGLFSNIAS